jgi:hypothetical protein
VPRADVLVLPAWPLPLVTFRECLLGVEEEYKRRDVEDLGERRQLADAELGPAGQPHRQVVRGPAKLSCDLPGRQHAAGKPRAHFLGDEGFQGIGRRGRLWVGDRAGHRRCSLSWCPSA